MRSKEKSRCTASASSNACITNCLCAFFNPSEMARRLGKGGGIMGAAKRGRGPVTDFTPVGVMKSNMGGLPACQKLSYIWAVNRGLS